MSYLEEDWSSHLGKQFQPAELCGVKRTSSVFRTNGALYDIAQDSSVSPLWAEFGVGHGQSARRLLIRLPKHGRLFLFDSWEGIPEPWDMGGHIEPAGMWKFPKLELSDRRVTFVDGLYSETLPYQFPGQLGVVNIDCDIYSSTIEVLMGCNDWICEGTILVFDELHGYRNYAQHEYRALNEWRKSSGKRVKWLAKEMFAAIGVVQESRFF